MKCSHRCYSWIYFESAFNFIVFVQSRGQEPNYCWNFTLPGSQSVTYTTELIGLAHWDCENIKWLDIQIFQPKLAAKMRDLFGTFHYVLTQMSLAGWLA